jgi:hypothetical protein
MLHDTEITMPRVRQQACFGLIGLLEDLCGGAEVNPGVRRSAMSLATQNLLT